MAVRRRSLNCRELWIAMGGVAVAFVGGVLPVAPATTKVGDGGRGWRRPITCGRSGLGPELFVAEGASGDRVRGFKRRTAQPRIDY